MKAFGTGIRRTTVSQYSLLFEAEQRRRNSRLAKEYINLHRFIARLLSLDAFHVEDAMFILSIALKDHDDSHNLPNANVLIATQYVIHASGFI